MRTLGHRNIVDLKYYFYSAGTKAGAAPHTRNSHCRQKDEIYLQLILEFVPETLYQLERHFTKANKAIPILHVKVRLPRR